MTAIYRIFPFLWNDVTIYGIDRTPSNLKTQCTSRPKEDPAYYWGSSVQRLCLSDTDTGNVTWFTIPVWLSYASTQGYSIVGDLGRLKPNTEFFISGP